MIYVRVGGIEYKMLSQPVFSMQNGPHPIDYVNVGMDVDLRISLMFDNETRSLSADTLHRIEQAIEQAINAPTTIPPVPIEVALPPGPRKIML